MTESILDRLSGSKLFGISTEREAESSASRETVTPYSQQRLRMSSGVKRLCVVIAPPSHHLGCRCSQKLRPFPLCHSTRLSPAPRGYRCRCCRCSLQPSPLSL